MAFVACVAHPRAQLFVPSGKDTLRGLPGVEVIVEELQPEIVRAGLTASGVRDAAVRQLRDAGIVVYPSQAENGSPAKPYLYVHVNAGGVPQTSSYAVSVHVQVRQTLRSLVTESSVVDAMTWDSHTVLAVARNRMSPLRDMIARQIGLFVEDWKAVH